VDIDNPSTQKKKFNDTEFFIQENISDEMNRSMQFDFNTRFIENPSYGYYSKHSTIFDELNTQRFVQHNKNSDLSKIMGSVVYTET